MIKSVSPNPRFLMLVSDRADVRRREVWAGKRPCPEYLRLEEAHGVELLDWSSLDEGARWRSPRTSLLHVMAALRRLPGVDAVFSDGEHVGVPLALAMRALGSQVPHLMLGHHLSTAKKRRVFRTLRPQARITRVLVHSERQLDLAVAGLRIPPEKLRYLPYGADTDFWSPLSATDEPLVLSVGREHRDYTTLARACADLPVHVFVAAGSLFSPAARQAAPTTWPTNFRSGFADHLTLRAWYARAAVVAVPLVPTDFQAGVTTILEAMAMAKAVVVSATEGQRDIVEDGVTGVMVPPGDSGALREAIRQLMADPPKRAQLGENAREAVVSRFGLDRYAATLARHLAEISSMAAVPAPG